MHHFTLHYLFDPLCGWCYASAPALAEIANTFPNALQLCPTGLFAGAGARTLDASLALHARSNDQRISDMTGQPFTSAYFTKILGGSSLRFDSMPMTRALTLAHGLEPILEPGLFHHLQTARYVNGLDTSSVSVVAKLSADWLGKQGWTLDSAVLEHHLVKDQSLIQRAGKRIQHAQALMQRAGATGVPLLLAEIKGDLHAISGGQLYGSPKALIHELQTLQAAAA